MTKEKLSIHFNFDGNGSSQFLGKEVGLKIISGLFASWIILFSFSNAVCGQEDVGRKGIRYVSQSDNQIFIEVNWNEATSEGKGDTGQEQGRKIDKNTLVSIRVNHFNFLYYSLKYVKEDRVVATYDTLTKLWSQLFRIVSFAGGAGAREEIRNRPFEEAILEWRIGLLWAETKLSNCLKHLSDKIGLNVDDLDAIRDSLGTIGIDRKKTLDSLRDNAFDLVTSGQQLDTFERIDLIRERVVGELDLFISRAELTLNGQLESLGKKSAGTIVTVTMIPVPRTEKHSKEGKPVSIDYFVHYDKTIKFHVGYAHSSLSNFDFEKVRSLSGEELFAKIKDQKATDEFSAFVGYELLSFGTQSQNGVELTLGTDFAKPGERVYLGVSGRLIGQIFVTMGGATSNVSTPGASSLQPTASPGGLRELFDTFTKSREWAFFFAISVGVI